MDVQVPWLRAGSIVIVTAFALLIGPGCTSQPEPTDDAEEFIGRPPPPEDDDPFFAHARSAEAVPADTTGRIGADEESREVRSGDSSSDAFASADTPGTDVDEEIRSPVEAPDEATRPTPDELASCFSCVKICPILEDGSTDCPDGGDDLICGWGSHEFAEEARKTARAHCDATLDMARHMPTYSDIEGQCPPATCR